MTYKERVRQVHPKANHKRYRTDGGGGYTLIWAERGENHRLAEGETTAQAWHNAWKKIEKAKKAKIAQQKETIKVFDRGGCAAYLFHNEEIVALLRYLLNKRKNEYFVIRCDDTQNPAHTGGIEHEGIKPDSMSMCDLARAGESSITVSQDQRLFGITVKTIRFVEIGKTLYWNLDNPWVQDRRNTFPQGSELIPREVNLMLAEFRPSFWSAPATATK
jgi:hypothetical protein